MRRMQVSLPPHLLEVLGDRARQDGVSIAEIIRRLVAQGLEAQPSITEEVPAQPTEEQSVKERAAAYSVRGPRAWEGPASMNQTIVNVHEAKTHLSRLLARVQRGETIVIANAGTPVARLAPVHESRQKRRPGSAEGHFVVPADFDDPLPEDILQDFGV